MKKRARILARVSAHRQEPKHQVNALRNYCKAKEVLKELELSKAA